MRNWSAVETTSAPSNQNSPAASRSFDTASFSFTNCSAVRSDAASLACTSASACSRSTSAKISAGSEDEEAAAGAEVDPVSAGLDG